MRNPDLLTQLFIFLASISSTFYAMLSNDSTEAMKRSVLVGKLLGSVMLAFFVMPAIMEYFCLSTKMTLLLTVIVAYGLEAILKASVKRVIKTIDKDGADDVNN